MNKDVLLLMVVKLIVKEITGEQLKNLVTAIVETIEAEKKTVGKEDSELSELRHEVNELLINGKNYSKERIIKELTELV